MHSSDLVMGKLSALQQDVSFVALWRLVGVTDVNLKQRLSRGNYDSASAMREALPEQKTIQAMVNKISEAGKRDYASAQRAVLMNARHYADIIVALKDMVVLQESLLDV